MKIGDLVKGTTAHFNCYRDGDLWYTINQGDDSLFHFPVPISDTGTGIFPVIIKSITLMRWIRKELESRNKNTLMAKEHTPVESAKGAELICANYDEG